MVIIGKMGEKEKVLSLFTMSSDLFSGGKTEGAPEIGFHVAPLLIGGLWNDSWDFGRFIVFVEGYESEIRRQDVVSLTGSWFFCDHCGANFHGSIP